MRRSRTALAWLARIENWTTLVAAGFLVWFVLQWAGLGLGWARTSPAPATVVRDLYLAAQDADAERLLSLLTPEARDEAETSGPDALTSVMDRLSRGHALMGAEQLRARLFGNVAVAAAVITMHGDHQALVVEVLERVDGQWRVRWPLGVTDWREAVARHDPSGIYLPLES